MTNVHGISVSGGSFPAEIWRRFMEPALADAPFREFRAPTRPATFTTWERGPSSLSYDPYYTAPRTDAPEPDEDETRPRTLPRDPTPALRARAASDRPSAATGALAADARRRGDAGARRAHGRPRLARRLPRRADRRCARDERNRVGVSRRARAGVRRVRRRGRARRARRAAAAGASRRGGDPARPARRAAPPLHRRVDVLGVRVDRGRAGRQPLRRPAGGIPGEPGGGLRRRGLARDDDGLRAGLHPALGTGGRRRRLLGRRRGMALQGARRARRARRDGCRRLGRPPPCPRGRPRGVEPRARDPPGRRRPQRRARRRPRRARRRAVPCATARRWAGSRGRSRSSSSGFPSSSSPSGRSPRVPAGARPGSWLPVSPPPASRSSPPGPTDSTGCARSSRSPRTRPARRATRCRPASSSSACPDGAALAVAIALFAAGLAWIARDARRGEARHGRAACLVLATTPYLAVWYLAWAVPLAAIDEDRLARLAALALTAYLLPQTIPL